MSCEESFIIYSKEEHQEDIVKSSMNKHARSPNMAVGSSKLEKKYVHFKPRSRARQIVYDMVRDAAPK